MNRIYVFLAAILAAGLLGAIVGALLPSVLRNDAEMTVETIAPDETNEGLLEIIERDDIAPEPTEESLAEPEAGRGENGATPLGDPAPNLGRDLTEFERFAFRDGFRRRIWLGYIPEGLSALAPVVFLVPGSLPEAQALAQAWLPVADANGIILLMAEGLVHDRRFDDADAYYVRYVLAYTAERHSIDRRRVFLFGHGRGALLAQIIANFVNYDWRAVGLHGGQVIPERLNPIRRTAPVRHYFGTAAEEFDRDALMSAGREVTEYGYRMQMHFIPGHSAAFSPLGVQIATDAWAWFSEQ